MMLLLLLLLLLLPLFEQMYEDSHLWVLSGNAKLQFPGELSCKPLTRSANDFCRYSFIRSFDVVVIVVIFIIIVILLLLFLLMSLLLLFLLLLLLLLLSLSLNWVANRIKRLANNSSVLQTPLKKSFKCWLLMIQSPLSRQHSITITGGNRAELFGVECNFQTFASSSKRFFRGQV